MREPYDDLVNYVHLCDMCEQNAGIFCEEGCSTQDPHPCQVARAVLELPLASSVGWKLLFEKKHVAWDINGNDRLVLIDGKVAFQSEDNGMGYWVTRCSSFIRTTIPYRQYIESDAWKRKRERRLIHDGYRCKLCGSAKNLQVHHVTYERLGFEQMDDLVTLCKDCHESVHEKDITRRKNNDY